MSRRHPALPPATNSRKQIHNRDNASNGNSSIPRHNFRKCIPSEEFPSIERATKRRGGADPPCVLLCRGA
ncbi:hypothetical protein HJC23_007360 [Cyclotella cryptica]|uniref:Uncharacterized protein n=1 Tax=Cyclotella cryptica TaxID=29204 RepID=A0ABD3Q476_9STRA